MKPFDKGLKKIFKNYQNIIIVEDHSEIGGLGEIVKVFAYENNYKGIITAFGLKDKFIHCYGDQNDLLKNMELVKIAYIKN